MHGAGMIIAVFTSIPRSVGGAEATVDSICKQTLPPDRFFWFLPRYCKRLKQSYPPVPTWTSRYSLLTVVECEDNGPITKVLPLVRMQTIDDTARIIILDDDKVYDSRAIEQLVRSAGVAPLRCGVGFLGHTFHYVLAQYAHRRAIGNATGTAWYNRVTILLCAGMVLYPRHMLGTSDTLLALIHHIPCLWLNDDHVHAIMAYRTNTPLYVVCCAPFVHEVDYADRLTGTNATPRCEMALAVRGALPIPPIDILLCMIIIGVFVFLIVFCFARCRQV